MRVGLFVVELRGTTLPDHPIIAQPNHPHSVRKRPGPPKPRPRTGSNHAQLTGFPLGAPRARPIDRRSLQNLFRMFVEACL